MAADNRRDRRHAPRGVHRLLPAGPVSSRSQSVQALCGQRSTVHRRTSSLRSLGKSSRREIKDESPRRKVQAKKRGAAGIPEFSRGIRASSRGSGQNTLFFDEESYLRILGGDI